MRTSSLFAVGALSLAALAVNACGGDDDPSAKARAALAAGCSLNSDCNDPLVCVFQRCHEQCSDSRDCPSGSRCVQGEGGKNVCQLPDDATCKAKSDCPGKQLCGADSQCRDGCASESECVTMQKCAAQGVCAETTELDPSGNLLGRGGSGGSAGTGGSSAGTGGSTSGSGGTAAGAGGSTAGAGGSTAGAGGSTGGAAGQGGAGAGGASGGAAGAGGCADGFADCDSTPGCETNLSLLTSCGSCTNVCGTTNAQSSCDMGTCKITSCSSGFADCDNDPKTGCEAPVSTDPLNCGACGHDCKQATCAAGFCGGVVIAKPLAATVPSFNPNSVVATETNVFLIHIWGNDSRVMRFPIEPTATSVEGKEIRKVTTSAGGMNSTQVEGDSLYWVEKGAPSTIFKYPADGTDVTPMGFFSTPSKPERLEVKATAFYWVDEDAGTKQIWTRQKDGQGTDVSVSVRPGITSFHGLIIGTTHLAWIERVGSAYNLMRAQLDGSNVEKVDVVTANTILADTGTELVYTVYLASPNGALKRQPWAAPVAPATITLLHQPYAVFPDGGSFLVQVDGGADVDTIFRIQPDGTSTKITKLPNLHYFYKPHSNFLFYRLGTGPTSLYRTVK